MLGGFGEKEPSFSVGGNVNWHSRSEKQCEGASKGEESGYHRAQQLLFWGSSQKNLKTLIHKNVSTPVFIAALNMVSKIWKQPKRPSIKAG